MQGFGGAAQLHNPDWPIVPVWIDLTSDFTWSSSPAIQVKDGVLIPSVLQLPRYTRKSQSLALSTVQRDVLTPAAEATMSGGAPLFWQQPLRYWRWAARERPALLWSCVIGAAGPVMLAVVPPIRRRLGDPDAKRIPQTYPSTGSLLPPKHANTGCILTMWVLQFLRVQGRH